MFCVITIKLKNNLAIHNISLLTLIIEETHYFFAHHAKKQVNLALTLRNWIIGFYIIEYEQNGTDRAEYGKALISSLSANLRQRKLKGFSEIALRLNRTFYLTYPQIQQTLFVEFPALEKQLALIQPTASDKLKADVEKVDSLN
jgi:hypothetical protein